MSSSRLQTGATNWSGPFTTSTVCKNLSDTSLGLVLEGEVIDARAHSVFVHCKNSNHDQAENLPTRFNALVVRVKNAYPRMLDSRGDEIDYQGNIKVKRNYVAPSFLTHSQLAAKIGDGEKAMRKSLLDNTAHLHPA